MEGAFLRVVEPVETAVHLVQHEALVTARTQEERMRGVPMLRSALDHVPALASLYIAYPNGDFFFVRHLKTE
ncbi:hypothetical protein [Macromonas nakdongensis]|uniref:hypothetical protein n=1 Tax=Macromonas nakdongensis TaxID=1843082 RepID=UPI0018E2C2C3|nr:hypothetical protein [Macromonas nakdongensis]